MYTILYNIWAQFTSPKPSKARSPIHPSYLSLLSRPERQAPSPRPFLPPAPPGPAPVRLRLRPPASACPVAGAAGQAPRRDAAPAGSNSEKEGAPAGRRAGGQRRRRVLLLCSTLPAPSALQFKQASNSAR